MSQQLVCDECGQPIDPEKPYYTLTGNKVQVIDGSLTVMQEPVALDYHENHVPGYKVMGETVVIPAPEPSTEPEPPSEPTPTVEPAPWEPVQGPSGTIDPEAPQG